MELEGPICPHCGQKINVAHEVEHGTKVFYLCPNCKKILSVGKI